MKKTLFLWITMIGSIVVTSCNPSTRNEPLPEAPAISSEGEIHPRPQTSFHQVIYPKNFCSQMISPTWEHSAFLRDRKVRMIPTAGNMEAKR